MLRRRTLFCKEAMHTMLHSELIQTALDCGVSKAAIIRAEDIVMDASFRDICKSNGCGLYGKCWVCPPDIGPIDELMEKVRSYSHGLLYQTIGDIEDSYDIEGMNEIGAQHEKNSIALERALKGKLDGHLHLSCGGCHLCERCAKRDDEPCRHPELALHPMEGYGIDVYHTTQPTELKYINGTNTVTYFGIVLF